MLIKWKCTECSEIKVSDSKQHHYMDCCECGKGFMDLEEYGMRCTVHVEILAKRESVVPDMMLSFFHQFGRKLTWKDVDDLATIDKEDFKNE